jgi:hypothetical protein
MRVFEDCFRFDFEASAPRHGCDRANSTELFNDAGEHTDL